MLATLRCKLLAPREKLGALALSVRWAHPWRRALRRPRVESSRRSRKKCTAVALRQGTNSMIRRLSGDTARTPHNVATTDRVGAHCWSRDLLGAAYQLAASHHRRSIFCPVEPEMKCFCTLIRRGICVPIVADVRTGLHGSTTTAVCAH